ncbi:MAG: CPBP family intramembrane metalloprotease [Phycisphaerales bacterium]|nr:MAG: CPBP family intramembrane metalloprotease [Phycisphaerales bacterium]
MAGGGTRAAIAGCAAALTIWTASAEAGAVDAAVIAAPETIGQAKTNLISAVGEPAFSSPLAPTMWDGLTALLALVILVVFARRRWLRLAGAPYRPLVFEPVISMALVVAMIVLAAMGSLVAQRMFGIRLTDENGLARELTLDEQARLSLGAYLFQAIVLLAFFLRVIDSWKPAVDRRMPVLASGLLGMGSVLAVWPVLQTVGKIGQIATRRITGETPDSIAHDTLRAMTEGGGSWLIVMSILVVVVTPVMEEVAYRGLLQDAIGRFRLGRWWAIIITSVLFALMHWGNSAPHAVATLFVLSLAFGWAYEKTGRLTAPIAMHMLFNLVNLALALAGS